MYKLLNSFIYERKAQNYSDFRSYMLDLYNMEAGLFSLMTSTELIAHIGQKVRTRRKFLELSRKELSERCGVSESTITRLEKQGIATLRVLVKVAIALRSIDTFETLFKSPTARSLDEYMRQLESSK